MSITCDVQEHLYVVIIIRNMSFFSRHRASFLVVQQRSSRGFFCTLSFIRSQLINDYFNKRIKIIEITSSSLRSKQQRQPIQNLIKETRSGYTDACASQIRSLFFNSCHLTRPTEELIPFRREELWSSSLLIVMIIIRGSTRAGLKNSIYIAKYII